MKLASEGPEQIVKFPLSAIRRLQLVAKSDEIDEDQATLELLNNDVLVGSLAGTLKLDTVFNTITVNAGEIKRLIHTAGSPSDVQVNLWDESLVSGQLQEQEILCKLKSGLEMKVPVSLVEEYTQPRPLASGSVQDLIKSLVSELNAEDWKKRDAAQEKLIQMGPVVFSSLKQMRTSQSPEAQQRIDVILKQIDKNTGREKKGPATPATPPPMIEIDQ